MAIMSVREGLQFAAVIASDTAPLHSLVQTMLATSARIRMLRDPTRGGIAVSLNEMAVSARYGIALDEETVPIRPVTQSACELLGLDPFYVANEGKLLAVVAPTDAASVLSTMRGHPLGERAAIIGHVTNEHAGMVVARTAIGGKRVISTMVGELLPRIC